MMRLKWQPLRKYLGVLCLMGFTVYVTIRTKHDIYRTKLSPVNPTPHQPAQSPGVIPANSKTSLRINGVPFIMGASSPVISPKRSLCYGARKLSFVVVVHSITWNRRQRDILRQTWLNQRLDESYRRVFLLGATSSKYIQEDINQESYLYDDIIQGSFNEHERNSSLKAVMGLRWVTENCSNAEIVLKIEENVFINIPKLMKYGFPFLYTHRNKIICHVVRVDSEFRLQSTDTGEVKWIPDCDHSKFAQMSRMPFCDGLAVFYHVSLAFKLVREAQLTPVYPFENVFLYGIVASKIRGVALRNAGKIFKRSASESFAALSNKSSGLLLVGVANTHDGMKRLWREA